MAELLSMVLRGPRCSEVAQVTGAPLGKAAYLQCSLKPGHPGPLHYDAADLIWWAADGDG